MIKDKGSKRGGMESGRKDEELQDGLKYIAAGIGKVKRGKNRE